MDGDSGRHAPLAMDAVTFRKLGHRLVDQLAEFLESLPRGPVTRDEPASVVREALNLNSPLPEKGTDPGPLLEETAKLLFSHSLFNGHPRFFGYITAPPSPIGILGDFLASAVNPNVGAWTLSPAATEIGAPTVRCIAARIERSGSAQFHDMAEFSNARQKLVKSAVVDRFEDGQIHALSIRTSVPAR